MKVYFTGTVDNEKLIDKTKELAQKFGHELVGGYAWADAIIAFVPSWYECAVIEDINQYLHLHAFDNRKTRACVIYDCETVLPERLYQLIEDNGLNDICFDENEEVFFEKFTTFLETI